MTARTLMGQLVLAMLAGLMLLTGPAAAMSIKPIIPDGISIQPIQPPHRPGGICPSLSLDLDQADSRPRILLYCQRFCRPYRGSPGLILCGTHFGSDPIWPHLPWDHLPDPAHPTGAMLKLPVVL